MVALRVICGFRDVATETAGVLAGVPPLALLAKMYATKYARRVELLQKGLVENNLREALVNSERQARQQLLLDWEQHLDEPRAAVQKVVAVIRPHLQVWLQNGVGHLTYRVTQVLTGHGCFGEYLCRIGKEPTAHCHACGAVSDSAEHTVEECLRWADDRRELAANIGVDLSLNGLLKALASGAEEKWRAAEETLAAVTLLLVVKTVLSVVKEEMTVLLEVMVIQVPEVFYTKNQEDRKR
ncbi:uncharacterized protein LOC109862078 [Pseudomyrmex gracilis]|uniref:uncharacterized protein LOC109862078 n=1 Tax=Pseudomyrmex gracilis TaxID=219809 RepID=UPI0009959171|nr:uncharacterized protein LOC109862078 [Pseudomyrmex gracilis]